MFDCLLNGSMFKSSCMLYVQKAVILFCQSVSLLVLKSNTHTYTHIKTHSNIHLQKRSLLMIKATKKKLNYFPQEFLLPSLIYKSIYICTHIHTHILFKRYHKKIIIVAIFFLHFPLGCFMCFSYKHTYS